MTRLADCPACQIGDHNNHTEVVQAVPKGVLGGVTCPCKGECRDNREERIDRFLESIYGTSRPWLTKGAG